MPWHEPLLALASAGAGLVVADVIVFGAPRLVAHRLPAPPPFAPTLVFLPLAGAWLSGWRPIRATLTQLVLAGLFAGLAIRYGPTIQLILAAVYCSVLSGIAYIDLDHRLVLNRLSYPGIVLVLATSWLWPGFSVVSALLGALTGLVLFGALQILGRGALGTGDTKLAVLIGAMWGLPGVLSALLLGIVLGGLGAAFFLLVLRRGRKEYMAYAPYLSAGAVIAFFLGQP